MRYHRPHQYYQEFSFLIRYFFLWVFTVEYNYKFMGEVTYFVHYKWVGDIVE